MILANYQIVNTEVEIEIFEGRSASQHDGRYVQRYFNPTIERQDT